MDCINYMYSVCAVSVCRTIRKPILLVVENVLRFVRIQPLNSYRVDKLRLRDLNNSLLGDLYPVYFQVEIEFNNETISVIFVRNLGVLEQFSRSYESISVVLNKTENNSLSKAKCRLFLRVDSYKMAKKFSGKLKSTN